MLLTQEDNEKRQRDWVTTFICLIVLSASFVFLRLFVKLKIVRNLGVDDVASVVALVSLRSLLRRKRLKYGIQACAIAMTVFFCLGEFAPLTRTLPQLLKYRRGAGSPGRAQFV